MTLPLSLALAMAGTQPLPVTVPETVAATQTPAPDQAAPPVSAPTVPEAAPPAPPAQPVPPPPLDPNEIVVTGRGKPPKSDPLQALNAETFKVVQAVDSALIAPVSKGYKSVLPKPARDGLHNALLNLTEPIVFVNDVLQLKIGRAFKTLVRFTVNSTVGVAGLVDVAKRKPINIPYHVNGFAYTMGYYGIKPGPFLYVPLLGPTTVRDMIGRVLDLGLLPTAVGSPFNKPTYALGSGALKSIDERLERDDLLTVIQEDCPDPYTAERTWYLEKRQAVIDGLHGRKVDIMSKLPTCLVDGLKKRAEARAALLPAGAQQTVPEGDLTPRP